MTEGWKPHLLKQDAPNAPNAKLFVQFWWKENVSRVKTHKKYTPSDKSVWLIYLCTCRKCGGQYVGKSKTKFKLRHSNHKREIKTKMGELGHHYGGDTCCGYENFSVILIEQVQFKNMDFLAKRGFTICMDIIYL